MSTGFYSNNAVTPRDRSIKTMSDISAAIDLCVMLSIEVYFDYAFKI